MTSTARPRRSLFVDVDGTILDHERGIAPSTVTALRAARARGIPVFLCTGRAAGDIPAAVRAIGVDGEITNGGAFAEDDGVLVLDKPMPRADAERMLAFFVAEGLPHFVQTHDAVFASDDIRDLYQGFLARLREASRKDHETVGAPAVEETGPQRSFRPVEEVDLNHVAKGIFASESPGTVDAVHAALGDRFLVIPGSMPMPTGSNGEVSLLGTDKGEGVRAVLSHRGLDAADAIGIGDSWNDREMFDVVGTSVVMGQADPELQRHADLVTTSVAEDGVATALARLGLIDPA